MSTILKFPLERVQRRSCGMHDTKHNAEVLVFEGVRYENSKPPKSAQTKRKTVAGRSKIKP